MYKYIARRFPQKLESSILCGNKDDSKIGDVDMMERNKPGDAVEKGYRSEQRPLRIINSTAPIRVCDNGGWTDTWFAE